MIFISIYGKFLWLKYLGFKFIKKLALFILMLEDIKEEIAQINKSLSS